MTDEPRPVDRSDIDRAQLFRFIVESAEEYAIFSTDLERRVTSWNVGAERMMGWSEAEFLGRSADEIFTPEDREKRRPEREAEKALLDGSAANRRWHMRRDGSRFWGDGFMRSLRDDDGTVRGFVKIFRDRTADLRAEEEQLEADRRKDEFLAMLAHELRNPLAAIGNASQISLRPGVDRESITWANDLIARQVRHLSRMIDDLLDISRINRGKIQLRKEPVHVGPLIARAVESASHLIQEKNHELVLSIAPGPMLVSADPTRLEQIVTNLLVNAVKYTDEGGRIVVEAHPEDEKILIRIQDSGIGLSSESITDIFTLFSQVDKSLERSRGGLGIGLSVVKRLVEMHGGEVWATSEGLGNGSEFHVLLPALKEPSPSPDESRPDPAGGSTPRKILVVDDNVDSAITLARLLQLTGQEAEISHDGNAAIDLAESFRPDVLILDLGMPGLSGFDIAAELRSRDCCRHSIFIALSGYGQSQDFERSRAAGFDHHLTKPVDFEHLQGILDSSTP